MNYIITPAWFYWMQVSHGTRLVCLLFLIASIILFIVMLAVYLTNVDCSGFDDDDTKRYFVYVKRALISCVVFAVAMVAIPSRDTLIEMQIAKYATVENANWTLETIKSAVDYIVEAIGSLK